MSALSIGDRRYVRDTDGTWRDADTWVKVPGARDLTLIERFDPKLIISKSGGVERVVVSGSDIAEHPEELGWCLKEGVRVEGPGDSFEVLVPIEKWEERERIPSAMVAPEFGDDPAERELAEVEREYREADQVLSGVTARRTEVLRNRAEEITRQRASEITGLSIGRIHQLIRDDAEAGDVDDLDIAILSALATQKTATTKGLRERVSDETGEVYLATLFRNRLRLLLQRKWITKGQTGFQLTAAGHSTLIAARARRRGLEERAID